jgi:hypothetical protein
MKNLFGLIEDLFVNVLFAPLDALRALEPESWTLANFINWGFLLIGTVAMVYWIGQLKKFNDANEEDKDPSAHSFL